MNQVNRRALLRWGTGLAAAAAVGGCATPGAARIGAGPPIPRAGPGEVVSLTYWSWLKDLQTVADVWNAANPQVQVSVQWVQPGNSGGYAKMFGALAAGAGPDIAQVELRQVPEFLLVGGLVDLARYGAREAADRYDPAAWSQVEFADGVYAVPQDTGPMAFYYRPAALEAVGAEPPATWARWREVAGAVRETGPDNYLEVFPVSDSAVFTAYANQAGAQWFRTSGDEWIVDMSDDATRQVAEFFDAAIDDDLVQTAFAAFSPGWTAAAGDGRIAAVTGASWADALIQAVSGGEGQWRVAPMPTWPTGFGSSAIGGSTSAVLANCAHPAEALDFILWLTSSPEGIDAMIENSGIGWSPSADYIGASRAEPSAWFSGQRYNEEIFVPAAADQNPDWMWSPLTSAALDALEAQLRRKITEGQPIVDGLLAAQQATVAAFRAKGLSVAGAA